MCNHVFGTKYSIVQDTVIEIKGHGPLGRGEYLMLEKVKKWYKNCKNCNHKSLISTEIICQRKVRPD